MALPQQGPGQIRPQLGAGQTALHQHCLLLEHRNPECKVNCGYKPQSANLRAKGSHFTGFHPHSSVISVLPSESRRPKVHPRNSHSRRVPTLQSFPVTSTHASWPPSNSTNKSRGEGRRGCPLEMWALEAHTGPLSMAASPGQESYHCTPTVPSLPLRSHFQNHCSEEATFLQKTGKVLLACYLWNSIHVRAG